MVDVRAILTRLPATLHGPPKHAALCRPDLVAEIRSARCVLRAIRDGVVKNFVATAVSAYGLRVLTPINVRDERAAFTELLDLAEIRYRVKVDLIVMRPNSQVLAIR